MIDKLNALKNFQLLRFLAGLSVPFKRKTSKGFLAKYLSNTYFLAGIALRLIFIFCFWNSLSHLSHFQFIDYFVKTGLNPYEEFLSKQSLTAFPYPAFMLYVFAAPAYFLKILGFKSLLFCHLFIILLADGIICKILMDWAPQKNKQVWLFYWLSPVVLYIGYYIGQIDVVPTVLLLLSLRYILKDHFYKSAVYLGLAIATKLSSLIAFPFMAFFVLFQHVEYKKKILYLALPFLIFIVFNASYLSDSAFFELVFKNPYQFNLFNFSLDYGSNLKLYIVPAVYGFLLLQSSILKIRNGSILMMFLCLSFGLIMVFIKPMPGWYYWLLTFLIYFCITFPQERRRDFILLATLQISYFVYFFFFSAESALSQPDLALTQRQLFTIFINSPLLKNMSFTVLQSTLCFSLGWIYYNGLREYFRNKMASRPFFIGIGGNSGTGKSTLANNIEELFTEQKSTLICGDDSHRWERGHEKWSELTHLNPIANDIQTEYKFLWSLRHRRTTERRFYDHDTGKFVYSEASRIRAKNVVIYEGLHPFYMEKVRKIFDLKIYLKPDDRLSTHWKINRDTVKRGYSVEKILEQISKRKKDYEQYIETQEKHADVTFEIRTDVESMTGVQEQDLYLQITCDTDIFFDALIRSVESTTQLKVHHHFQNDKQTLILKGYLSSDEIASLAHDAVQLQKININKPTWKDGINGLLQVVTAFLIAEHVHDN